MNGEIIDENDKGVAIDVVDNNGIVHEISMFFDGEITYHDQNGYPSDPEKRTEDENEHVNQARRYAKFTVYQERGYDTVEHTENPDYVNAVREAINELSDEEFERYFGALYQQLRSHHEPGAERLVDIPPGEQAEDAIIYEVDVYLGIDVEDSSISDEAEAIADAHGLDSEEPTSQSVTEVSQDDIDDWQEVGEELLAEIDPAEVPLDIAAVSGIHVGYPNAQGEHEVQEAESPLDRAADARIELMPADPGPLEEFREWLDHHLRSQVRDTIAGMGLMPPEPFQTVGFGKFIYARRYDHYDLYPQFHIDDSDKNTLLG